MQQHQLYHLSESEVEIIKRQHDKKKNGVTNVMIHHV